jgi:hypothetical protein
MGNAVDEPNLGRLLEQYAAAGLGGVEIAPIYGAVGYENRYLPYLSPQWLNSLGFTVQQAGRLGMGVDLTMGTGWPFGGPHVTPAHAATKLVIQQYSLRARQSLAEKIVVQDPKQREAGAVLQALTAYGDNGEILDLSGRVAPDGTLAWQPQSGAWELYAAFSGKTRQMVKRAAPGGEGYTLDHLSRPAVDAYIDRFEGAFAGKPAGIRAFYNDSYEVYGADWSPEFFGAFKRRRGYDLRPFLRELAGDEKTERVARLKADYRETMGEMLLENFTRPWTAWAHGKEALTRNQAHGSPGNLLDLYAAVDIPECETFGSSYFPIPGLRRDSADVRNVDPDPVMLKFASSAGHVAGRPLVSSETFTWLTEHFKTSFAQGKPEVEQLFLAGVNHVFYHGVTYSPADVPWPGWLFYASVNFTPANSLWPHLKGLNEYITRCQSVLQAGQPDNELLVYWPIYDVWSKPEGREMLIKVHDIDAWLHPTPFYGQVKGLMKVGYSLDFVSDAMLAAARSADGRITTAPSAPAHRVLIIPQTQFMPPATLRHVLRLAGEGATLILEKLPEDVPGLGELEGRRAERKALLAELAFAEAAPGVQRAPVGKGQILLAGDVQRALAHHGVRRETLTDTGLQFIRRATPEGKYYYLVNHTAEPIDARLPLNAEARSVVILDPQSGRAGLAAPTTTGNTTTVRVQVAPGEALILKATREKTAGIPPWFYGEPAGTPLPVQGEWALHFTEGGPERPADQKLTELVSWTGLPDPKAESFSGTGRYTITFDLPDKKAAEYLLHLGDVRESARVWVNGREVGLLWSIPFAARIGKYLQAGTNTLAIEVVNLMANRIRDMDRKGTEWRKYHEINFVNIDYKPFDASGWPPQPSGLLGPVTITPLKNAERQ